MQSIDIKVLTTDKNVEDWIPYRAHECDAGADLLAAERVTLAPQCSVLVKTGVAVDIPVGYVGLVFPRSGLASKRKLRLGNCVGVIDAGYQGEIMVSLYNDNADFIPPEVINIGNRISVYTSSGCGFIVSRITRFGDSFSDRYACSGRDISGRRSITC